MADESRDLALQDMTGPGILASFQCPDVCDQYLTDDDEAPCLSVFQTKLDDDGEHSTSERSVTSYDLIEAATSSSYDANVPQTVSNAG